MDAGYIGTGATSEEEAEAEEDEEEKELRADWGGCQVEDDVLMSSSTSRSL